MSGPAHQKPESTQSTFQRRLARSSAGRTGGRRVAPRQIVVDREPGQYLGHPTTVLLEDGRTIWAGPKALFAADSIHLCEPGILRSPDGGRLAALLRENRRTHNSFVILSDDEVLSEGTFVLTTYGHR